MGILILIIFSIGLYQIGKWSLGRFIKPRAVVATESAQQSLQILPATTVPNWDKYEVPTFKRRGLPPPVLMEKRKRRAKKKMTQPRKAAFEVILPTAEEEVRHAF